MEGKDQQELEDLLIEARAEEVRARLHKGNRSFLKIIALLATLNIILFPFDYERISQDLSSALGAILVIQGFILGGSSIVAAALAGLIKFAPWSYANRFIRASLIFYLVLSGMLLFILIMNLARYRFHLFS